MPFLLSESTRRELQQKLKFDTIRISGVDPVAGEVRLDFYEGHTFKGHIVVSVGSSKTSWVEVAVAEGSLRVSL